MQNEIYSIEAEQYVLAAILINPEIYEEVAEILSADDFYSEQNKIIYASISKIYSKTKSLDLLMLLNDIVSRSQRDDETARNSTKEYLMQLSENVPVITNVKEYANIIKEKSLQRKYI